jgi:hypothetical protein
MATATHTASTAFAGPYLTHEGLNVATGLFITTTASTVGDTILMARIPTGVDIVGVYGSIGLNGETAASATIGISGAATQFGSLAGSAAAFAAEGAKKFRVSLSDSAQPQYTYLVVAPSGGTFTDSQTIAVTVLYQHK